MNGGRSFQGGWRGAGQSAATGLRIGELLAVRWRSLDLEIGTLSVRESVYEGQFQSPKTQKSRRTIPLRPQALSWLREHRLRAKRTASDDWYSGIATLWFLRSTQQKRTPQQNSMSD